MTTIKKTALISVSVALVAALALAFIFRHGIANRYFKQDAKQEAQTQVEAKMKVNQPAGNTSETSPSANSPTKGISPSASGASSSTNQADSRRIEITAQQSTGNVSVTTKLYNFADGTCALSTVAPGGTNSQNAPIMFSREFSTCAGFNIPVSVLGKGTWNITLKAVSSGTTTTQKTSVEVQ